MAAITLATLQSPGSVFLSVTLAEVIMNKSEKACLRPDEDFSATILYHFKKYFYISNQQSASGIFLLLCDASSQNQSWCVK